MATEKVVRLSSGVSKFIPEGSTEEIILGYQQNVSLARSSEKKELLSNDEGVEQTVMELEVKPTYELNTEIADVSLENLSLAFKGSVKEKTYAAGDKFPTGKVVRADTEAVSIGDLVLKDGYLYTALEVMTEGNFDIAKCAENPYSATTRELNPESRKNNLGKYIYDGINLATGKAQILVIESINLGFDGDFAVSGSDFAKISLKGKALKKSNKKIFTLIDA
ncbi:MAG: hypothetical protein PQJ49_05060 [Sphaerochaetaceae bacterium]|nr:hypothetical protein [Sphaerochaetaceae bacterium]